MNSQEKNGLARALRYRWYVWGIMATAFMVVFFHRLAAGVVREDLVRTYGFNSASFGSLSSMYFYAYMIMQIPVGLMADSLGARITVSAGMLLAGAGSILFGLAPNASLLFLGRFLVGIGVSTVFVSIMKVQSQWFREKEFATVSGLTSLVGNMGGILAQTPLALMVAILSWRLTFATIGGISFLLALLCWLGIRNSPEELGLPAVNERSRITAEEKSKEKSSGTNLMKGLKTVIRCRHLWPALIFFACFSGNYLAFSGTWGIAYMKACYGLESSSAGIYVSMAIFGAMTGSMFMGWSSDRLGRRRLPLILASCAFVLVWGVIVFAGRKSALPLAMLKPLFFLFGFSATAYVISWAIVKEVNPPQFTGIAIAILNAGCFLGTALLTTLMGVILDHSSALPPLEQFHRTFMPCFICAVAGMLCVLLLPETHCHNVYEDGTN